MKFGLSLALISAAAPCLAETAAGVAYLSDTSVAERPLSMSIWFPAQERASASIGGNPVFVGVSAAPDARFPEAVLPLVVVSHGGLRSAADSGAWLSSSIARAGYIVVEVNAPRPEDATMALDEIWQRPLDIRRAIDLMLTDNAWGQWIDKGRISVAGFALGATAALSVAGAEMDVPHYMRSCTADNGTEEPYCGWFAAQGVELTQTSREGLARLARDTRVASVVAVNPEYLAVMGATPAGVDTLLVSLGDADGAQAEVGDVRAIAVPGASAFDAFAVCTDAGPDILLEEEGDASLCGVSKEKRQAIHQDISEAIISFLAGSTISQP